MFKLSKQLYILIASVAILPLLASCSFNDKEALAVRQFHLKSTQVSGDNAQMVRGEQQYRLRGALTRAQRRERLGQYYTIEWNTGSLVNGAQPTHIVMDYQQANSGSEKKRIQRQLQAGEYKGKTEFQIIGKNYHRYGRLLAWRVRLMSNSEVLAEKQSYLWR